AEAGVAGEGERGKGGVPGEDGAAPPRLRREVHAGRRVEQHAVVDDDAPGVGLDQAREALERERLAGARGPEQHSDAVARRPRHVEGESRQPLGDLDREPMAHAARAPRRPARTKTTHDSTESASTSTAASTNPPVCTALEIA